MDVGGGRGNPPAAAAPVSSHPSYYQRWRANATHARHRPLPAPAQPAGRPAGVRGARRWASGRKVCRDGAATVGERRTRPLVPLSRPSRPQKTTGACVPPLRVSAGCLSSGECRVSSGECFAPEVPVPRVASAPADHRRVVAALRSILFQGSERRPLPGRLDNAGYKFSWLQGELPEVATLDPQCTGLSPRLGPGVTKSTYSMI